MNSAKLKLQCYMSTLEAYIVCYFVACRVATAIWHTIVFTLKEFSENKEAIFYWLSAEQYDAVCRVTIHRSPLSTFCSSRQTSQLY
jgi:hypothetical protein